MPTTIYNRLNDREFVYSRNDLRKIAYWTHEKYVSEIGADPEKTEQDEDGRIFQVFEYPDEWIEKIDEITDWYFKKKRKIGDIHIKREQRAIEIKLMREKRIAEGHFERENAQPANIRNESSNKSSNYRPKQGGSPNKGTQNKNKGGQFRPKPSSGGYSKPSGTGQNSSSSSQRPGNNQNRPKTQGSNKPYSQNKSSNYSGNSSNKNYNNQSNPNSQLNSRNDRTTFNSFDSDINSEFNYNKGFSAKYKSGPTPRASYYEAPSESKFTKKVEIDSANSLAPDGTKKRKRIAKALFVAAPEENKSNE